MAGYCFELVLSLLFFIQQSLNFIFCLNILWEWYNSHGCVCVLARIFQRALARGWGCRSGWSWAQASPWCKNPLECAILWMQFPPLMMTESLWWLKLSTRLKWAALKRYETISSLVGGGHHSMEFFIGWQWADVYCSLIPSAAGRWHYIMGIIITLSCSWLTRCCEHALIVRRVFNARCPDGPTGKNRSALPLSPLIAPRTLRPGKKPRAANTSPQTHQF